MDNIQLRDAIQDIIYKLAGEDKCKHSDSSTEYCDVIDCNKKAIIRFRDTLIKHIDNIDNSSN